MTTPDTFEHLHNKWEDEYKDTPEFVAEEMAIDVTDEAFNILSARGLTRSWLAEAMGVSRQRVSTIFGATPNLTLLSIAQIGVALQVKPKVILDVKQHFIQAINDAPLDYEDYKTMFVSQQTDSSQHAEYGGMSALDTTFDHPLGVPNDATS